MKRMTSALPSVSPLARSCPSDTPSSRTAEQRSWSAPAKTLTPPAEPSAEGTGSARSAPSQLASLSPQARATAAVLTPYSRKRHQPAMNANTSPSAAYAYA